MAMTETSTEELPAEGPAPEPEAPAAPPPSLGGGAAANDHKVLGSAYFGVALLFLIVGGVLALLMRAQLAGPELELLSDREYRTLFTFHGTFLVFLFLLPAWIGIATAVVPLQIGAARLAFPRLHTLTFWLTVVGGGLMAAAPFAGGGRRLTNAWTLSAPIPSGPGFRGDAAGFLILGIAVVATAAVLAAVNLIVSIIKFRAPGLTTRRLPLFTWSVLVSSCVLLLSLPVLVGGLGMLFVEQHYGARLFSGFTGNRGGNPLLWPRLFWFAAYPMLWALLLPALGLASEIVAVFARRPIADRTKALGAMVGVGVLSFLGWGSEVRNLGSARPLFIVGALVVLAPAASLVLNWLLTLRKAANERGPDDVRGGMTATPMLYVLGFLTVLGAGLAASVVSALDATRSSHGNYWQVGQQHLLFFAPATIALVAAAHYWGPKLWGRRLSDGLGKLELLLLVGGAHLSFLPALLLGAQNMTKHLSTYDSDENWQIGNMLMSLGSVALVAGVLAFVLNLLVSVVMHRGRVAEQDPWGGHTLEWTAPTPLPRHNFDRLPEVRSATPALDLRSAEAT